LESLEKIKIMRAIFTILILTFVFGGFAQAKPQTNGQLKLTVNQQKTVTKDRLKIKFVSVVEDSRCPTDTNCVWAGNAKVQIKVTDSKGASKIFELNTNLEPNIISFAGYEIKIVNLNPHPATNIRINRNGYAATFTISKK
jgi:hypothetical protein